jgi:hypothetical protein
MNISMRPSNATKVRIAVTASRATLALAVVFLTAAQAKSDDCPADSVAVIERHQTPSGGGQGYRMTYCIPLPLEAYWRFKTDFDNDFLTSNPHITAHQFVDRTGDVVLTENRYAHNTKRLFRWQTVVYNHAYRLEFELQNPDEAGQDFHFGTIQLKSHGRYTMVHQTAQFKFSGDALWAFYPWRGGMRSFLKSFVAWERQTAQKWYSRNETYLAPAPPMQAPARQIFSRSWRHQDR